MIFSLQEFLTKHFHAFIIFLTLANAPHYHRRSYHHHHLSSLVIKWPCVWGATDFWYTQLMNRKRYSCYVALISWYSVVMQQTGTSESGNKCTLELETDRVRFWELSSKDKNSVRLQQSMQASRSTFLSEKLPAIKGFQNHWSETRCFVGGNGVDGSRSSWKADNRLCSQIFRILYNRVCNCANWI